MICSAISRVISASHQWAELLASASNAQLQIVISNTTEVGVQLVEGIHFSGTAGFFSG